MKKFTNALLLCLLACAAGAAEKTAPLLALRGGSLDGAAPAKVFKAVNVERRDGMLGFNGRDSVLGLKLPETPGAFTVVADVLLPELPEKSGAIFSRPGFHNMMEVAPDGRLRFTIFGADKKRFRSARSETLMLPGVPFRVAGAVEPGDGGALLTIYVNGVEAGRARLEGPVYPYGDTLTVGCAAPAGKHMAPLAVGIRNLWVFNRALDGRETLELE